jgi:hypothetical protein
MPSDLSRDNARLHDRVIEFEAVLRLAHRALLGKGLNDRTKALTTIERVLPAVKEQKETHD